MKKLLPVVLLAALPSAAWAHTGVGAVHDFSHGLMHPVSGLDHILAMIAVGLIAARMGGRALWLVPLAFVGMMVAGGVLGMTGAPLPFVELGIGLSVVVLGAIVAAGVRPPAALAMSLVGVFALFHGHAHGAEAPADVSGLAYAAGFVSATALLHATGAALGLTAQTRAAGGQTLIRIAGAAMAIAGIAMIGAA